MTYYNSLERFGRVIGEEALTWIKEALEEADAIVIGAGAGLSTFAGFVYYGTVYPAELEARSLFINCDIDSLLNKLVSR